MILVCKSCGANFVGARKRRMYCDICFPLHRGWKRRWHGNKIVGEQKEIVIAAYMNGYPLQNIIEQTGVSETTIRRFLLSKGIRANRLDTKKINPLSVTELAYIAGIIDGEGCIGINRRCDREYRHGYSFTTVVRVVNTYYPLILWLKNITGLGSIAHISSFANSREKWTWRAHKQQAVQIIEAVYPYLIVKCAQAKLFLEMAALQHANYGRFGVNGMPKDLWTKQNECYLEMKKLNKRGNTSDFVTEIGWLPEEAH